jgi:hypothetical protein
MKAFSHVFAVVMMLALSAQAEVWTSTNHMQAQWPAISADGHVFVVAGTATHVSYDYGATWRSNNVRGSAVAISADGTNIIVGASSPGAISTSTNAGATWITQSNPPAFGAFNNVRQIAASGDARRLALLLYGTCPIFTSTDGGVNWSTNNDSPVGYWTGIASSADGRALAATGQSIGVWISTNYGVNWSSVLSSNATGIASSADGRRLLAAGLNRVYLSSDFGATWSSQTVTNLDSMTALSSADGARLGVACYFGLVISTNSGATWMNANAGGLGWQGAATSADAHRWMGYSAGSATLAIGSSKPTPVLEIARTNANVTVSWLMPSSALVLEQNELLHGGNWSAVPDAPGMDPDTLRYKVSVSTSNNSSFFRLSHP